MRGWTVAGGPSAIQYDEGGVEWRRGRPGRPRPLELISGVRETKRVTRDRFIRSSSVCI